MKSPTVLGNLKKPNSDGIYLQDGKFNVPFLIKNADLLFEAGDYPLARKIYTTLLHSGEYTATLLYRLGKCFEAEGKLEEAYAKYEESISFHPTADTFKRLAAILIRQNKIHQAAKMFSRSISLRDGNVVPLRDYCTSKSK